MKNMTLLCLTLLAASPLSLRAEESRLGIQGMVSMPMRELKTYVDTKTGQSVGLEETFDMMDGHMLRPRLDYTTFPEVTVSGVKQRATNVSAGMDYLYFPFGKPEGFYFTMGVAAIRWSLQDRTNAITQTTTKTGVAFGVGCQWNALLGTEARFVRSEVNSLFAANTLQAGITLRF